MTNQTPVINKSYDKGYIDGITAYAWHGKNGQEVGICETSLESAIKKRMDTYNYSPPQDVVPELLEALKQLINRLKLIDTKFLTIYTASPLEESDLPEIQMADRAITKAEGR